MFEFLIQKLQLVHSGQKLRLHDCVCTLCILPFEDIPLDLTPRRYRRLNQSHRPHHHYRCLYMHLWMKEQHSLSNKMYN